MKYYFLKKKKIPKIDESNPVSRYFVELTASRFPYVMLCPNLRSGVKCCDIEEKRNRILSQTNQLNTSGIFR